MDYLLVPSAIVAGGIATLHLIYHVCVWIHTCTKYDDHIEKVEEYGKQFNESLTKMDEKFDNRFTKMDEKFDKRFTKMDEKFDRRISNLEKFFADFKTKFESIYKKEKSYLPTSSASPIRINPSGEEMAKQISAPEIFETHKDFLVNLVEEQNLTNAYDIDNAAFSVVNNNLAKIIKTEQLDLMKNIAYEKNIFLNDVFSIFGVYLRDYILEKNNIKTSA